LFSLCSSIIWKNPSIFYYFSWWVKLLFSTISFQFDIVIFLLKALSFCSDLSINLCYFIGGDGGDGGGFLST